jgi:hypothetical protein
MNPKIEKITREMEKTRVRITDDQTRLKELERQKKELEDLEIVAKFRAANVPISEIDALVRAYRETGAPPVGMAESPRTYTRPETGSQEDDTDE